MKSVTFTDGSSVSESTTTYQIASCGQCDWIGEQHHVFFDALQELGLHVFQTHMPVQDTRAYADGSRDPLMTDRYR